MDAWIPFQKRNFLGHRMQNVPEDSAKTSLRYRECDCISKRTMRSSLYEENKVEFFEGLFLDEKLRLPSPTKRKLSSFELSLSIFCLLTVYFNLEMQNSGLKTTAWWSRGSHFVENGYSSVSNMVKVNIHEHWTRIHVSTPYKFLVEFNEISAYIPLIMK